MLYTRLGQGIAGFALAAGLIRLAIGLAIGTGLMAEPAPGIFGTRTAAEWLEGGVHAMLIAIVVVALTQIRRGPAKP